MDDVLNSFAYSLDFVRELVAPVSNEDMVAQPSGLLNHPAWAIGHLTFSCQALGGEIGMTAWLPEPWGKRYGMGSIPVPDVSAYESKKELLEFLRNAQTRITVAVQELDETQLSSALPEVKYRPMLPTIRHGITQILVAHTAYHVGQLVVWSRRFGLPPIDKPFL